MVCAGGVALGHWQAGRAEEKRVLGRQLDQAMRAPPMEISSAITDAAALVSRRVLARGRFDAEYTVLLDNKLRRGRPGYEVVTPLRLDGSHVLVNRGWVAAGRTRDALPSVPTPAGVVRVEGVALARLARTLELGEARGRVRQNVDIDAFGAETGLRLLPLVIQQQSALDDGLVREWPRPDSGIEKHESYAFQWYSLAVLAVALFIGFSIRRVRPE